MKPKTPPTVPILSDIHEPLRIAETHLASAVSEAAELSSREGALSAEIREASAGGRSEAVDAYMVALGSGGTAVEAAVNVQSLQQELQTVRARRQVVAAAAARLRRDVEHERVRAARLAWDQARPAYLALLGEILKAAEALGELTATEEALRTALLSAGVTSAAELQTALWGDTFRLNYSGGQRGDGRLGRLIHEIRAHLGRKR